MKLMYLMKKTCSKFFLKELLLIFQITTTIALLTASITPFTNYYSLKKKILDTVPDQTIFYSSPYNAQPGVDCLRNIDPKYLENVATTVRASGVVNGVSSRIYFYSRGMFDKLSVELSDGEWTYTEGGAFVNREIASLGMDKLKIQRLQIEGTTRFLDTFELEPLGTISKDENVYDLRQAGNEPDIGVIGVDYSYQKNINPEGSRGLVIIPCDLTNADEMLRAYVSAALVFVDEGNSSDELLDKDPSTYVGSYHTMGEIRENSMKRLVGTYNLNLMIGIVLMISSFFSIGGYSYLKIASMNKQRQIYAICGCRPRVYLEIVFLSTAIIEFFAIMLSVLISSNIQLSEGYDQTASFVFGITYTSLLMVLSLIIALMKRDKNIVNMREA